MDTTTLVEESIADGEQLISHLKQNGFDVDVAFWVHTSEEGLWFLYIASPVVDTEGLAAAFRRVYRELSRYQVRWVLRSDIRLIGSHDPIAVDAIAYRSGALATRYGGRRLGNMIIEEAYIYPQRT
jgi:hypothetical protein